MRITLFWDIFLIIRVLSFDAPLENCGMDTEDDDSKSCRSRINPAVTCLSVSCRINLCGRNMTLSLIGQSITALVLEAIWLIYGQHIVRCLLICNSESILSSI